MHEPFSCHAMDRIALISPPWPLFNRPSIQLGALKAHLRVTFPDLAVSAFHVYLGIAAAIGYAPYRAISGRTWLAETVYAPLLTPDRMDEAAALFRREAKGHPDLADTDFFTLVARVKAVTDRFIDGIDWRRCGLVGVSASLCQMTAALYFLDRVRRAAPDTLTVLGGSIFSCSATPAFFHRFPQVDAVVAGEGEKPLARLVAHLLAGGDGRQCRCRGLVTARSASESAPGSEAGANAGFYQMADLSALPPPDYSDYFRLLATLPPARRFFPVLPLEISRGCVRRAETVSGAGAAIAPEAACGPEGDSGGCAFCNLNLQWAGYRKKTARQAADEAIGLIRTHRVLAISYMDNALPPSICARALAAPRNAGLEPKVFGEIRATTSRRMLERMRDGGLAEAQIGIEALVGSVLRKMKKGVTALENIAIMKWCEELGIKNASNLIAEFPGTDDDEVARTLRVIDHVQCYRPLLFVRFWMGRSSPVFDRYRDYGIRSVSNHPNYRRLLGEAAAGAIPFMIQQCRGDRAAQRRRWRPVEERIDRWRADYERLHRGGWTEPILSWREGGDFIIIRRRRIEGEPETHRLTGTSAAIYRFCRIPRSLDRIVSAHPGQGSAAVSGFLSMMAQKRLMVEERGRYLSLAVRAGARGEGGGRRRLRSPHGHNHGRIQDPFRGGSCFI